MGDRLSEIIDNRFGSGYEIFDGIVSALSEEEMTVDVEMDEGIPMPDVRLRSVSDGGKAGFVCFPEIGSEVVFAKIRGVPDYVLLKTSSLQKVVLEIGTTSMIVTSDGYALKKGEETLLKILSDFMQELQNVIVIQGTSPNVPKIEAIKTRLKDLLK